MGGAQPLAATMAGYCMLCVECDATRIDFRLQTKYLDHNAKHLDQALDMIQRACAKGAAISVGLLGNGAEVIAELVKRNIKPDLVTDQTSAHDPVNGYLPVGWSMEKWQLERKNNHQKVAEEARKSMAYHVNAMLAFHKQGVPTMDYGNNSSGSAELWGRKCI